jgi:hypothetical protein
LQCAEKLGLFVSRAPTFKLAFLVAGVLPHVPRFGRCCCWLWAVLCRAF